MSQFRLPLKTRDRIAALAKELGCSKTEVVVRAVGGVNAGPSILRIVGSPHRDRELKNAILTTPPCRGFVSAGEVPRFKREPILKPSGKL